MTKRDVTPEATKKVIEQSCPAIINYIQMESLKTTPFACLSRAKCGVVNHTLVLNLPGNSKAVTEHLQIVEGSGVLTSAVKSV